MEKFIVVRVCKGGGGGITSALTEKDALNHFNNWSDEGNAPHNIFVKVFDTVGHEYEVSEGPRGQCICGPINQSGWDF